MIFIFLVVLFFLTAMLILTVIWVTKQFKLFNEKTKFEIQDLHSGYIVRMGGIPLISISLVLGLYLYYCQLHTTIGFLAISLLATSVLSIIGVYEDIFPDNSPWIRLTLTLLVSLIASILLQPLSITTNIAFIDKLLKNHILLTIFAATLITGITHAYNIVDGLNGLSSGSAIFAFLAIIHLSLQENDFELVYFGMILISIILGFFVFNYPIAKIFLGDGGAYWMGSSIAILSLLFLTRNSSISIWTILLINFYPLFETIFSIFRKILINKASPFRPDADHLHMITFRILSQLHTKQKADFIAPIFLNPISSFALLLLPLLGATLAAITRTSFAGQIISLIGLGGIYITLYWKLKRCEESLGSSLSSTYKNMI